MFAPVVQRYKASGARRITKRIAEALGFSRQYYYKLCNEDARKQVEQERIIGLVKAQRKLLPRLGTHKLHYLIKDQLEAADLKCGRDKLFYCLAKHDLLIKPKRRYTQTTNSKHWLRKHPNIAKDIVLTKPEQLWVTDITYIKTEEGNCYANMVTDAFSR